MTQIKEQPGATTVDESNQVHKNLATSSAISTELRQLANEAIPIRRYQPSGICPPSEIFRMIGVSVPTSILIGVLIFLLGLLTPLVGIFLFWLSGLSDAAFVNLIFNLLLKIAPFLGGIVLLLGFPALIGRKIGSLIAKQVKKRKCRNSKIEVSLALANALICYGTFSIISVWITGTIQLTSRMWATTFERSVWPWWLYALIAIDFIIVVAASVLSADQALKQFCENCLQWYEDSSWFATLSLDSAKPLIQFLGTGSVVEVEKIKILPKTEYPRLLIKASSKCTSCSESDFTISTQIEEKEDLVDQNGNPQTQVRALHLFGRRIQGHIGALLAEHVSSQQLNQALTRWSKPQPD